MLPATLRVPYQSGASSSPSSSPSSCSGPGADFDLFLTMFSILVLKPSCSQSFSSMAIYPLLRLISWNLTTRRLAVTGGGWVHQLAFGHTVKNSYNLYLHAYRNSASHVENVNGYGIHQLDGSRDQQSCRHHGVSQHGPDSEVSRSTDALLGTVCNLISVIMAYNTDSWSLSSGSQKTHFHVRSLLS